MGNIIIEAFNSTRSLRAMALSLEVTQAQTHITGWGTLVKPNIEFDAMCDPIPQAT